MKKYWIMIICLLLAMGGLASGCTPQVPEEEEEVFTSVTVAEIERGEIKIADNLTGSLFPRDEAVVMAEMPGEILRVYVSVGDDVQAGQTLLTLNKRDLEIQEAQARAALASLQIQYQNALEIYQKYQRLYEEGAIAFQQVDNARVQYESIRDGSLRQAQSSLELIQNQMRNAIVTAPMSGTIGQLEVMSGQLASPGSPLATIIDIETVKARFSLSESQINQVQLGDNIMIYVRAVSPDPIEATVSQISPQADSRTRNFSIDVSVDNPERSLRAGMTAVVELVQESVKDQLVVPEDAIRYSTEGDYLYVVRENIASMVRVEVLLSDGILTAVQGDLEPGEQVIVLGMERVTDGTHVRIVGQED